MLGEDGRKRVALEMGDECSNVGEAGKCFACQQSRECSSC